MYKGNKTVLPRILSLILATGLTLSGIPVGIMAAETEDAAVQQETVQEAEEPAAPEEEEEESASPEQEEEDSSSVQEEKDSSSVQGEEQEALQEEEASQDEDEAETAKEQETEEEKDVKDNQEEKAAPAKAGTVEGAAEDDENKDGSGEDTAETIFKAAPETENVRDASANEEVKNGLFTEDDGYTYYYEDGSYVTGRFVEIDGSLYYFDYNGHMKKDEIFEAYDNNYNKRFFYYASADGSLITDGWYRYGEHWQYYDADGHQKRNEVAKINGSLYGFNLYGYMCDNKSFNIYDNDSGKYTYYRAHEGGVLFINEWYNDDRGSYYFGEEGKAANGLYNVDGILYLFSYDGCLLYNSTYSSEEGGYISDEEGKAYEANDGWNQVDDKWVYFIEGIAVNHQVIEIDGKYYGFGWDRKMYDNESFDLYDNDSGNNIYYRAHEGGALYVNEWYNIDHYEAYYYGEGGKAANGLYNVDGTLYLFSHDGCLLRNKSYSTEDGSYVTDEEGKVYKIESDGWNQVGGKRYYFIDGKAITDQVIEIDGKYYGFGESGKMYDDNETFCFYDYDSERFIYYRAHEGGALYINEWFNIEYFGTYYYGEGGRAASGPYNVDGIMYLFSDDGSLLRNGSYSTEDESYISDDEGKAYKVESDGWNQVDGSWHYFVDGKAVTNQILEIDGKYYGFDGYGRMYDDNETCDFYDYDSDRYVYYRAHEGGVLYVNEWYHDDYGEAYYYGEGGKAPSGPYNVDGIMYLFSGNGYLIRNGSYSTEDESYISDDEGKAYKVESNGWNQVDGKWYYFVDGKAVTNQVLEIDGQYYGFDWEGRMYNNEAFNIHDYDSGKWTSYRSREGGVLYVNEWYNDGYYSTYYYGEGGKAAKGPYDVDGIIYLFTDNGYLIRNGSYSTEDGLYISDSAGKAYKIESDGWNQVDGSRYYYIDGEAVTNQVIEIEGQYYGFDWDGRMYDDESFDLYDEDSGKRICYRARSGGALYAGEWFDGYRVRYYYDSDARGADGARTIDNVTYVFQDAEMLTNTTWSEGNTVYVIDENGVAEKISGTGWIEANGDWFYSKDGTMLKSCVEKIGSAYYGFNSSGRMYDDETFDLYDDDSEKYIYYRARSGGALYVNSWVQPDGEWYYYGAEGKGADGFVTLGGKSYLFDDARMLTDTTRTINGVTYVADSKGIVNKLADGWNKVGDDWYYVADEKLFKYGVYQIKDKYYGFDHRGRMYNNETFIIETEDDYYPYYSEDSYRAQVGGALYVNSWVLDCSWYYYGADGKALTGKQKVGGKDYYFNSKGEMLANCYVSYEGKVYQAAANGVLSEVKNADLARLISKRGASSVAGGASLRSAWKQLGGKWYYFDEDGFAVKGTQWIDGAYYFFDDDNVMQTGWIRNGSQVMYASSNGKLASGEQKIDGKWYYFTDDGRLQTGIVHYNDNVYLCGKDGAYIKTVNKNGWTENSGTWYYFRDGEMLTGQAAIIGDHAYYFNYNGEMATNVVREGRIYDANGYQVTGGWYEMGAEWYYVDPEDGYCVSRDQTIGGKKYYFNEDYQMFIGEREVDGELRTYDASGVLTKTVKLSSKNGWTLFGGDYYYYADGKPYTGWVGNYYVSRGVMQTDKVIDGYYVDELGVWVKTQGWVDHNNKYVKANGKVAMNEWLQISGSWYYFDSDGDNYRNDYYTIGTKEYAFDSSGKWVATADNLKDETKWVSAGGKWYYISKGRFVYGEKTIDGKNYYFVNGEMSTNSLHYNGKKGGYVWYGADGTMANLTGWNRVNGKWYWFNQDSTVPTGWIKSNGKTYYIYRSGGMATGVRTINDKVYQFDSSGALVKQITKQNGWFQNGSDWYYFKDGVPLSRGIHMIDNVEYGFSGGKLAANEIVGTDTNWDIYSYGSEPKFHYIDGSGKVSHSSGWRKVNGIWYYFGTNGIMLTGIQNIDGKMYNFGDYSDGYD